MSSNGICGLMSTRKQMYKVVQALWSWLAGGQWGGGEVFINKMISLHNTQLLVLLHVFIMFFLVHI